MKKMRKKLSTLRGRSQTAAKRTLHEYTKKVVKSEDGSEIKMKHEDAWDAVLHMGCERIQIGDRMYHKMACVLNKCEDCKSKWSSMVPNLELNSEEMISYVVWGTHYKCTYHSNFNMGVKDGEQFCKECELMQEEMKKKLKGGYPKVKKQKTRIKVSELMKDFVKPGGTYEKYLWTMYYHVTHVKLLGTESCAKKTYEFAKDFSCFIMEVDYSERYQPEGSFFPG